MEKQGRNSPVRIKAQRNLWQITPPGDGHSGPHHSRHAWAQASLLTQRIEGFPRRTKGAQTGRETAIKGGRQQDGAGYFYP